MLLQNTSTLLHFRSDSAQCYWNQRESRFHSEFYYCVGIICVACTRTVRNLISHILAAGDISLLQQRDALENTACRRKARKEEKEEQEEEEEEEEEGIKFIARTLFYISILRR